MRVKVHQDKEVLVQKVLDAINEFHFYYRTNSGEQFQQAMIPKETTFDVGRQIRSIDGLVQDFQTFQLDYTRIIQQKESYLREDCRRINKKIARYFSASAGIFGGAGLPLSINALVLKLRSIADYASLSPDLSYQKFVIGFSAFFGLAGAVIGYSSGRFFSEGAEYDKLPIIGNIVRGRANRNYMLEGRSLEKKMDKAQKVLAKAGKAYHTNMVP